MDIRFPKRKQIRLKHYDYSQNGYYFVTVCTHMRRPIFADGGLEMTQMNNVGARFIAPEINASGLINQTPTCRTIAEQYLLDLKNRFTGVDIDFHEIMSTHIHVIFVLNGCKAKLGEIIRAYKALVTHAVGARFIAPKINASGSMKGLINQTPTAPETNASGSMNRTPTKIWQRGYYEHVIRNESALNKIREYIINNPDKEEYDWGKLDVKP